MPSLVPKTKAVLLPADVEEVFVGESYKLSRERVIAYIKYFEENFSVRTEDELKRPNVITERFSIAMPTEAAYMAEIELCAGIKAHTNGELTDDQLKSCTDAYIASHTLCFQPGTGFWAKSGDFAFWTWHNVPLYYASSSLRDGWTCNLMQMLIIKAVYSDRNITAYKL